MGKFKLICECGEILSIDDNVNVEGITVYGNDSHVAFSVVPHFISEPKISSINIIVLNCKKCNNHKVVGNE